MEAEHDADMDRDSRTTIQPSWSCAIVFCPIPLLSWFFPCVGHLGICSSDGTTYDFAGPYTVNAGRLLFGSPARYLPLNPGAAQAPLLLQSQASVATVEMMLSRSASVFVDAGATKEGAWDAALQDTVQVYQSQNYNILVHNCHHMVVDFLNSVHYDDCSSWNLLKLAAWVFVSAHYVGPWHGILRTWLPFCVLMTVGVCLGGVSFLAGYAVAFAVLVGWFTIHTLCCRRPAALATKPGTAACGC